MTTEIDKQNGDQNNNNKSTPPKKANGTESNSGKSSSPKKRRKVNHACIYCRRSHMTCDLERPCTRCVKRNIGHLCHDEPREPPKKMRPDTMGAQLNNTTPGKQTNNTNANTLLNPLDPALAQLSTDRSGPGLVQPTPVHASHPSVLTPSSSANMGFHHWMYSPQNQLAQDMHLLHPNSFFNTSEVSNEFSLLNDFLSNSLLEDGIFTEDGNGMIQNNMAGSLNNLNIPNNPFLTPTTPAINSMPPPSAALGNEIIRPASGVPIDRSAREKYLLMAADPTGSEAPEERLKKLLKAKYDAGLLKPFNYVKGYARMQSYMDAHLQQTSTVRIIKQLAKFRPKFRELAQHLTDEQLVYVEVGFERKLMEYDRILASMAIPACCWRRTGEIYRGNKEMAELIHVPMEQLRDGKIAIHELFAESSLVMYWENFSAIAFDASQKAVLTTCVLKNMKPNSQEKEIKCSFSFTIRRDQYNIPSLIVGNFLPIYNSSK